MPTPADILAMIHARKPAHALERALYTDPDVYRLDLEELWYREWLFAVPACELPKPGSVATLQVGAYPVVLARGSDGAIRAFHNVCRHRGQRICPPGKTHSARLVCPYHQWTFALDGRLIGARDMGEGFDKSQYALKPVACREAGGMVFICLAEEPPAFDALGAELARYLEPSGLDEAKVAFTSTIVEKGNWKLVIENNRECYHCGGSHPSLCRTYSDNPRMTAMEGPDSASPDIIAHWQRCEAAGLPSRFVNHPEMQWRLARIPLLDGAESYTMDTRHAVEKRMGRMPFYDAGSLLFFHYPNSWNHFLGDHAITFRVLPLSPTETQVTTTWLVHKDAVEGVDYDLANLTEVWLTTNDEDRRVVEENQFGILSPAYEPGPYSALQEEGVIQFIDWYCRRMESRLAPRPAMAAE